MVASEFLEFFTSYSYANRIGAEDCADRLNLFTVILFLVTCLIVTTKQYVLNPISCYIPVKPDDKSFNNYLTDFCWVHGTIPLRPNERLPHSEAEWAEYDTVRRITYYQWVPFILGLQCILFYIPHIAWQALCAYRSGGDIFELVKAAADAATLNREAREAAVTRVTQFLEDMILCHQQCRKGRRAQLTKKAVGLCGIFVSSKRLGTQLVFSYLFVKIITIINAIMQILLIQRFLGFYPEGSSGQKSNQLGRVIDPNVNNDANENLNGFAFGLTVLNHIRSGQDWPDTLLFPRVAYCRVPGIRLVGVENTYTAQCTLPVNMLNEKIYIFFWFWIVLLIIINVVSLCLWLLRMIIAPQRRGFIRRYLKLKALKNSFDKGLSEADMTSFIDDYLRRDGVFLVRMLALNAGEVITSDIVLEMYKNHLKSINRTQSDNLNEKTPCYV